VAANAKPDGYTLLSHNNGISGYAEVDKLFDRQPKTTRADFIPLARLAADPVLLLVNEQTPYKTLKEFVDAAKAKPGSLKQSGGSVTSRDNIIRLQLQHATGAKWAFVSFPGGGERLAALLGGHVDIMVIEPQEAGEQVRAGKLRVLAQLTEKRLAGYADVPTLREAGFDVTPTPQIRAVVAPPQQPADASAYWESRFAELRKTASWKKYIQDNQLEESYLPGAELKKSMADIERQLKEQYTAAGIKTVR